MTNGFWDGKARIQYFYYRMRRDAYETSLSDGGQWLLARKGEDPVFSLLYEPDAYGTRPNPL